MTSIRSARLFAAAWFVLSVVSIRAHAAAIETFNYPNGNLDNNGSATNGWADQWSGGSIWKVENGRAKVIPPTNSNYQDSPNRREAVSIATSVVYMSWILQPGDMGGPTGSVSQGAGAGVRVAFADTTTDTNHLDNQSPMVELGDWRDDFGSYVEIKTSLGGIYGENKDFVANWTVGQTYHFVGRLEFDQDGSNERWTIWINPSDESDPSAAQLSADLGYSSIGGVELFEYSQRFAKSVPDSPTFLDDLQIGDSWAAVVPEPKPFAGIALGMLTGVCLRRRRPAAVAG
jgi:hypothetical protein